MSTLKTIDELRELARKQLTKDFENNNTPMLDEDMRRLWMNGFMAGYLHCQMDDLNENIIKNMREAHL